MGLEPGLHQQSSQGTTDRQTLSLPLRSVAVPADGSLGTNAFEIRLRAGRRIGEMMALQKETVGLNSGGWKSRGVPDTRKMSRQP